MAKFYKHVTPEIQATILRLHKERLSIQTIADTLDYCYTAVRRVLMETGAYVPVKQRDRPMTVAKGGISPVELQRIIRKTVEGQEIEVETPSGEIVKGRIEEKYPHFARVAYYIRGNRFTEDIRYLDLHKKAKER